LAFPISGHDSAGRLPVCDLLFKHKRRTVDDMKGDDTNETVPIPPAILAGTFVKVEEHVSPSTGRETNFSIFCNPVCRNIYQGYVLAKFCFHHYIIA
jgi:hypothetical protein